MLWLLAMAELLFRLPMAVVLPGAATIWVPQVYRDPPATGEEALITVVAVDTLRGMWVSVGQVH